jgi:hypothetical protein
LLHIDQLADLQEVLKVPAAAVFIGKT